MFLRSIRIENYRGIREALITFETATVIFGENDCGRSSIIEALLLILGAPDETFEARLRPFHLHESSDHVVRPLRIRIHVAETAHGVWELPASLSEAFPFPKGSLREFDFEFTASRNQAGGRLEHAFRFTSRLMPGRRLDRDPEALSWLRDITPVLSLRASLTTGGGQPPVASSWKRDPEVESLARHHHNLLKGETADLAAELEAGAAAARVLIERHGGIFAGAAPLMSAMASDILNRPQLAAAATQPQANTGAQKLAALLLLGALLRLLGRGLSSQSRPVLLIETPEANLHPMTLAAVWRILERIVWQEIVITNSSTILSSAPLGSIRRITRHEGVVTEWSVQPRALSRETLRRVSYHLRSRRSAAMFARCWLLVEGETEYWILPELARVCGFDFQAEGVACVEFAQCGLSPLIKLATHLGIEWSVLADGDEAGRRYAETATLAQGRGYDGPHRVTRLRETDIEHCFWHNGFAGVIQAAAGKSAPPRGASASSVIRKAIERTSKPQLALSLIDAAAQLGPESIPEVIRNVIQSAIVLARSSGRAGKK